MGETNRASDVVNFWLNAGSKAWFSKNAEFDTLLAEQFGGLQKEAAANCLTSWETEPNSALALILLLDQFSRNLYRDDTRANAQDPLCLKIARASLENDFETHVNPAL